MEQAVDKAKRSAATLADLVEELGHGWPGEPVEEPPAKKPSTGEVDPTEPPSPADLPSPAAMQAREEIMEGFATTRDEHYWAVRPSTQGRSFNLTEEELARLRNEQAMAQKGGLSWAERGPARAADGSGPSHWRGQAWREGSQRYSNGGGQRKEYYARLAHMGVVGGKKGGGKKGGGNDGGGKGSGSPSSKGGGKEGGGHDGGGKGSGSSSSRA